MAELLIAWQNGLLLPKVVIITIVTIPIWGGIIAGLYCYFNHYLLDKQPKEFKRMKW